MATTAIAITTVLAQPSRVKFLRNVYWPITVSLPPSIIITAMIGTAITPLITALQNNALIGSRCVKFSAVPASVAKATML